VLEVASARGVDSAATLELTRAAWVHSDEAAGALASGHRRFTESSPHHAALPAEASLRRLVHGGLGDESVAAASQELGLGLHDDYVVVVAGAGRPDVAHRLLASYADARSDRVVGIAASQPLDPWGVPVGYGDRVPPSELPTSFQGAQAAWEMAEAFALHEPQHPDDVQLLRAVHELPGLGDRFVERCFGHLDQARRDATRETLHAWFASQGSADAAADALHVHRNTLRYRLRTFAEASGLSLDRPEDTFTVWWALRRLDQIDHLV
jgi:hypothetical protein